MSRKGTAMENESHKHIHDENCNHGYSPPTIIAGSIIAAAVIIALLPSLPWFKFELFSRSFYNIELIVEGVLLMIATFAMEL